MGCVRRCAKVLRMLQKARHADVFSEAVDLRFVMLLLPPPPHYCCCCCCSCCCCRCC
jgi:hypothetical protein